MRHQYAVRDQYGGDHRHKQKVHIQISKSPAILRDLGGRCGYFFDIRLLLEALPTLVFALHIQVQRRLTIADRERGGWIALHG